MPQVNETPGLSGTECAFDGPLTVAVTSPLIREARVRSNTFSLVHWTVDDDGEKIWIATPHLSISSFSTRTTTPAIAYVIGLPGWKSLVKYTFTPGA